MADQTIETLTRAEIAKEVQRLSAIERELTTRAAAAFKAHGFSSGLPEVSDRTRDLHARAAAHLNGHASLLPRLPSKGASEADIVAEREAVRLALSTLTRADVLKATAEAVERATTLTPEWKRILGDYLTTGLAFKKANDRREAFLESLGPDAAGALSLLDWQWLGVTIVHHQNAEELSDLIAKAKAAGVSVKGA